MDIRIFPRKLSGTVSAVPSKIESGIKLVCASLSAKWTSYATVENVCFCEDILILLDCLKAIGSKFEINGSSVVFHSLRVNYEAEFDFKSSKFAFMLIVPMICKYERLIATIHGDDSIIDAEADALMKYLMSRNHRRIDYNGSFPIYIDGQLPSGEHYVESYSYIPGLLLALAHNKTDSFFAVKNKESSKAIADIAIDVLKQSGIPTSYNDGVYVVRGGQKFSLFESSIGGDFSLAANFVVANAMTSNVRVLGLDATSMQPERIVFTIIRETKSNNCKGFSIDVSDILSVLPILCVYASTLSGKSVLYGIKTDYFDMTPLINGVCEMINSVGGKATAFSDRIEIEGVKKLHGGTVDAKNNSQIVMAASILSTLCTDPVEIKNIDSITSDYPTFFDAFRKVGGIADII